MVEATVTGIHRGTIESDWNAHIEGHTTATASDPSPATSRVATPVYNLVIEHPEATILWDTGSHPAAGDGHWPASLYDAFEHADADEYPLPDALAAAGYDLADVDCVVQSHLHVDHAGGLYHFAGTDTPVFVHEEELEFAYLSAVTDAGGGGYVQADFDHDLHWRVVSRKRTEFFEDLEFLHLPGHSPGLLGLLVHLDDAGTVLFAGDQFDVAANHEDGRPPGGSLLWDRQRWEASRRWVADLERRHDATVVYGHDPDQHEMVLSGWP
ncbi:MAG: N-acyl homoserine lactonase family protein [Haloarculaceae archaeon]